MFRIVLLGIMIALLHSCKNQHQGDDKTATIATLSSDTRLYEYLQLNNGLRVIVVSDPSIVTPAASLGVGVGSYHDPELQQGLAHLVEHIVMTGSSDYPQTNPLLTFLSENGGITNATTSSQYTNYYFKVSKDAFENALDIFSTSIKRPILDKISVNKELDAVHHEWHKIHQQDSFIANRVRARIAAPTHPSAKLGGGNKHTLNDKPESQLSTELTAFHQRYYTANAMNLVLVGNQSLEQLKTLAKRYFSDLPSQPTAPPLNIVKRYQADTLGQHVYIKSSHKNATLALEIQLPNLDQQWQNQSRYFLQYMFSSSAPGSLKDVLKKQQWINALYPRFNSPKSEPSTTLTLHFELTEQGKRNKDVIIKTFFEYVELLKTRGITDQYERDISHLLQQKVRQFKPFPSDILARTLTHNMFFYPIESAATAAYIFKGLDKTWLTSTLDKFTPDNMLVWHIDPDQDSGTNLQHADGSYSLKKFSQQDLDKWLPDSTIALTLPTHIDTSFDPTDYHVAIQEKTKPAIIHQQNGLRVLHGQSKFLRDKTGYLKASLINAFNIDNPESFVAAQMVSRFFIEQVKPLYERAYKKHGLRIMISSNYYGYPNINIVGNTYGQTDALSQLLDIYTNLQFSQPDLARFTQQYKHSIANIHSAAVQNQLRHFQSNILKRSWSLFTEQEINQALDNITLDTVSRTYQKMLTSNFLDMLAFGYFDKSDILKSGVEFREQLGIQNTAKNWNFSTDFQPSSGKKTVHYAKINPSGYGLNTMYIYPDKNEKVSIQLSLLNRFFNTSFFKSLRTELGLGYIVRSYTDNIHDFPAFGMEVVSSEASLETINKHIETFQIDFLAELGAMSDDTFNGIQTALLTNLNKPPTSIMGEVSPLLSDWNKENFRFDKIQRQTAFAKQTTKQDLINLYTQMVLDKGSYNIKVELEGHSPE